MNGHGLPPTPSPRISLKHWAEQSASAPEDIDQVFGPAGVASRVSQAGMGNGSDSYRRRISGSGGVSGLRSAHSAALLTDTSPARRRRNLSMEGNWKVPPPRTPLAASRPVSQAGDAARDTTPPLSPLLEANHLGLVNSSPDSYSHLDGAIPLSVVPSDEFAALGFKGDSGESPPSMFPAIVPVPGKASRMTPANSGTPHEQLNLKVTHAQISGLPLDGEDSGGNGGLVGIGRAPETECSSQKSEALSSRITNGGLGKNSGNKSETGNKSRKGRKDGESSKLGGLVNLLTGRSSESFHERVI